MSKIIKCPKCLTEISIDDALSHQLEEQIKAKYDLKEKELQNLQRTIEEQVQNKLKLESQNLENSIRERIVKDNSEQIESFKRIIEEKNKKLTELSTEQIRLMEEKEKFESQKRSFEIEMKKKQEEITNHLRLQLAKEAEEKYALEVSEVKKQLEDARKMNADLDQKLKQGSQQTQGEVLELEMEELLKREFPYDQIVPVAKGVNGADITQMVSDKFGQTCGSIVWETKRTKAWTEGWISKLKEDQREKKAELAIIVSTVLPKDIKNFGQKEGVWVTDFASSLGLAIALRSQLIAIAGVKQSLVGKNEKMELLYDYLSGVQFRQRIEAIVESFTAMKEDLERERRGMVKIWEKREKQIGIVIDNTVRMYGDLEGMIGKSLPKIEMLELAE